MAKSKDVVFSSEKLESQEKLKKILIPVAALLIIAALVAIAALVLHSVRGQAFYGGEDTAYPYSWSNSSKGVMTLDIDNGVSSSCSWMTVDPDPANMPTAAAKKQPKGKSRFIITPAEAGRHNTFFLLLDQEGLAVARLDMLLETSANEKGVFSTEVLSSSVQMVQAQRSGGEGTNYPYSYLIDADGLLALTISGGAVVNDWECTVDNTETADYSGPFYEDDDVIFYMIPGSAPGSCNARFFSEKGSVSLALELNLGDDGNLIVSSETLEGGDALPAESEEGSLTPEEAELQEKVAKIAAMVNSGKYTIEEIKAEADALGLPESYYPAENDPSEEAAETPEEP